MKPTTPIEALEHVLPLWLLEAQEIIDGLAAIGWHLAPDAALPASVPAGDPRSAPAQIDNLSDRSWAVWQLVSMSTEGLTSKELNRAYSRLHRVYPAMDYDSPRKRLPELARAGHVVRTEQMRNGAHVWLAVGERKQMAA
jgi:hypothetical protein